MSARLRWGWDRKTAARKRPVPLVRAYTGPWPILSHRTMAEVMAEESAAAPRKDAGPRIKSGVTKIEGRRAKIGDKVPGGRTCEPCMEPVSSPAAGSTAAATSEVMDVTAGETAPVSDPVRQAPDVQASAPVAVPIPLEGSTKSPPVRVAKIAIADVPSGMESAAEKWRGPAERRGDLPPVPGEDGKVWCHGCDARVPTWFGRDCISATCSLKGLA